MAKTLQQFLLAGICACCAMSVQASSRPAVVELFTSEGCSSCPPAEAYVGELSKRDDVLALSFHVQYWDSLGWHDRFGLPEAALRQRTYSKVLGLASAYTPQVVVDGQRDFVGSDRASIARVLGQPREGVAIALAVRDGQISVDLGAQADRVASDVVLVAYQRQAVSAIGRGENAGRTLTEFNIVRGIRSLGHWDGQSRHYQAKLESLPADSTDIALLVQPLDQAPIIGAASQALR